MTIFNKEHKLELVCEAIKWFISSAEYTGAGVCDALRYAGNKVVAKYDLDSYEVREWRINLMHDWFAPDGLEAESSYWWYWSDKELPETIYNSRLTCLAFIYTLIEEQEI